MDTLIRSGLGTPSGDHGRDASCNLPTLKPQEIPFDDPRSNCRFVPGTEKPFLATPAAIEMYGTTILSCLVTLQQLAIRHGGLDPSGTEPYTTQNHQQDNNT